MHDVTIKEAFQHGEPSVACLQHGVRTLNQTPQELQGSTIQRTSSDNLLENV